MTRKSIDKFEQKVFPLNSKAKDTLNLLVAYVNQKTGADCVDFISGLRPEVQDEVANALWYFNTAMEYIPMELKYVKETVWKLMVTIKKEKELKE